MGEYLSKKAVLDWLTEQYFHGMGEEAWNTAISKLQEKIESGAFDAPDGEIQRLRAALERIKKWADDPEPVTMLKIWNLANETLKGDENA